jgi:glycolate oxidase
MPPSDTIVQGLTSIVGADAVLTRAEDLIPYSFDGTAALRTRPSAVVFPRTTAHVAECVRLAAALGTPIVTRGSGTGLSGGSVPSEGSLVVCLTQMDAILEVDPRNLTLRAEPGAITQRIDEAASRHGLFYPPDPGSLRISTIGGNVAENSGGLRGLKYGVTRDYVMGLEVVLADGRIARLGSACVKDVAGYSLKDLFIGSEGTLGIITEVLLKLVPRPPARRTMLALYESIEDAAETVSAIVAAPIIPCTLEFLDRMTAGCVEDYARVGLPTDCEAVLLMETDGHPSAVADEATRMEAIARDHRARDVRTARDDSRGCDRAAQRAGDDGALHRRHGGRVRPADRDVRPHGRRQFAPDVSDRRTRRRGDGSRASRAGRDLQANDRAWRHDHRRARRGARKEALAAAADRGRQLRADARGQGSARSERAAEPGEDL